MRQFITTLTIVLLCGLQCNNTEQPAPDSPVYAEPVDSFAIKMRALRSETKLINLRIQHVDLMLKVIQAKRILKRDTTLVSPDVSSDR